MHDVLFIIPTMGESCLHRAESNKGTSYLENTVLKLREHGGAQHLIVSSDCPDGSDVHSLSRKLGCGFHRRPKELCEPDTPWNLMVASSASTWIARRKDVEITGIYVAFWKFWRFHQFCKHLIAFSGGLGLPVMTTQHCDPSLYRKLTQTPQGLRVMRFGSSENLVQLVFAAICFPAGRLKNNREIDLEDLTPFNLIQIGENEIIIPEEAPSGQTPLSPVQPRST